MGEKAPRGRGCDTGDPCDGKGDRVAVVGGIADGEVVLAVRRVCALDWKDGRSFRKLPCDADWLTCRQRNMNAMGRLELAMVSQSQCHFSVAPSNSRGTSHADTFGCG